jgi:hypothetical protein
MMTRESPLARAVRDVAEVEDRINEQQLLIVRLRVRGVNATRAAHLLDAMKGARQLAQQRLAREEAANRMSFWLQAGADWALH